MSNPLTRWRTVRRHLVVAPGSYTIDGNQFQGMLYYGAYIPPSKRSCRLCIAKRKAGRIKLRERFVDAQYPLAA